MDGVGGIRTLLSGETFNSKPDDFFAAFATMGGREAFLAANFGGCISVREPDPLLGDEFPVGQGLGMCLEGFLHVRVLLFYISSISGNEHLEHSKAFKGGPEKI